MQAQGASLVKSINVKGINTGSLQTLPKTEEEGIHLNSFYEARIIMIIKPGKGMKGKGDCRPDQYKYRFLKSS